MKLVGIIMLLLSMFANGNTEYIRGTATEKWYHEDGDYCTMIIIDTNGDEWVIDDSVAPLGSDCIIQLDNNGTEYLYDDEVTGIIYLQMFD